MKTATIASTILSDTPFYSLSSHQSIIESECRHQAVSVKAFRETIRREGCEAYLCQTESRDYTFADGSIIRVSGVHGTAYEVVNVRQEAA